MRRIIVSVLVIILLSGCGKEDTQMEEIIKLRRAISECSECTFKTVVTADYGDSIYSFGMDCTIDKTGAMNLTVTDPETISGIAVRIDKDTGKFVFNDKVLVFEMIADGQLSPVGAPFLLLKALRSGYISTCGTNEEKTVVLISDSFANTQYEVQLHLDSSFYPDFAEIIWNGRRILSLDINEFLIL